MPSLRLPLLLAAWCILLVRGTSCPGKLNVKGYGPVEVIPTGWLSKGATTNVSVREENHLIPHMGTRSYFAESCSAGTYKAEDYLGLNLLGKTMRYTTDLSKATCGCNVALYLVSMKQNKHRSECNDFYCDANNVCGESCAEIDIQEANQHAWHSTLHTSQDHSGLGGGYGGGAGWNGPRDWSSDKYAPGGQCIDTSAPFDVDVSFPISDTGALNAMQVTLSQKGHSCPLSVRLADYPGMASLSEALRVGMTPVVSYWSSNDMLWMDGKGDDGHGPCATDDKASCSKSVKFYDFSIEDIVPADIEGDVAEVASVEDTTADSTSPEVTTDEATAEEATTTDEATTCPGRVNIDGLGSVSVVNAKWNIPGEPAGTVAVPNRNTVAPHMTGRSYLATTCTSGEYNHKDYVALKLLGKTFRYTSDMTGAGCGCNAALYLTSLAQNEKTSDCNDYYCDANNVCGESCAEIDIQEANMHAWHSTLHTSHDHSGVGGGYGGGSGWNGPRDWDAQQYGPGGKCIDTSAPFQVAVSFPVDAQGHLAAMEVMLSQKGRACPLAVRLNNYPGMAELHEALAAGMTPIISYWSANDMLWMDGKGQDGQGPCAVDHMDKCSDSVKFYNFSIHDIPGGVEPATAAPVSTTDAPAWSQTIAPAWDSETTAPAWSEASWSTAEPAEPAEPAVPTTTTPVPCSDKGEDCRSSQCCASPGMQCYEKNEWWASCRLTCTDGVDPEDDVSQQTPWTCSPLGPRTEGMPPRVVVKVRSEDLFPDDMWKPGAEVVLRDGGEVFHAKVLGDFQDSVFSEAKATEAGVDELQQGESGLLNTEVHLADQVLMKKDSDDHHGAILAANSPERSDEQQLQRPLIVAVVASFAAVAALAALTVVRALVRRASHDQWLPVGPADRRPAPGAKAVEVASPAPCRSQAVQSASPANKEAVTEEISPCKRQALMA